MKRHHLITVHLILSTFFLPFLLMMPLSGVLYLTGLDKGEDPREEVFQVEAQIPESKEEREAFFRNLFKEKGIDFDFEYIRDRETQFTFRPSSRTHYVAHLKEPSTIVFEKVTPRFVTRMMELHMGHGPQLFRSFEILFGIGLIVIAISGIWLSFIVPAYRTKLFLSFCAGAVVFFSLLVL